MYDEITVIDNALTRPWTVDKRYVRNPDLRADWPESICPEYNANVVIGGENFAACGGKTKWVRRDRIVPCPELSRLSPQ
jgi:hypothetical protein